MFALLRSAICGTKLTEEEREIFSRDGLQDLLILAEKHEIDHLLVYALKQNGLIPKEKSGVEKGLLKAIYRYEQLNYELHRLCEALETAKIPILPLKGSVLRKYYPEPWMRTSCDIDILVHEEDLDKAVSYLSQTLGYDRIERGSHDFSLYKSNGIHFELHFDLTEEGQAKKSSEVLQSVWGNASLCKNSAYRYEMSDAFFYFYHIAHMAKHFEVGGCGIRPFLDLWILNRSGEFNTSEIDLLLARAGLEKFAMAAKTLSEVWFDHKPADDLSLQMQDYLLQGGVFGSSENRVALHQAEKGGRLGYFKSRMFAPYEKLKRYYPILMKHRWLMPVMQVRRWLMIFNSDVFNRTKRELRTNHSIDSARADEMHFLLKKLGF
ncbi:MAG: nucleotidyltransferase family protein [Clostridia bacterium]|nr:nucleotidyltransferase family protein [Clostridia bacterium]